MLSQSSIRSTISAAILLAAVAGAAHAVPIVYNLGVMPGGTYSTRAVVAGDGVTVTAFGDTNLAGPYQIRTFRWTVSGGITHILPLADARGGAIGNDGFAISGGSGLAGQGFHWNIVGGTTMLNPLSGDLTCRSTGISSGAAYTCGSSVNGGSLQLTGRRAVRWTYTGVPQNLGIITGGPGTNPGSDANGISSDGTVVVGFSQWITTGSGTKRAFRWQAPSGPMLNLGTLPGGTTSEAFAVSSDNTAICGNSDNGTSNGQPRAFRWKANTGMQDLGSLGPTWTSWGMAINYNGSCIVGNNLNLSNSNETATIWTAATGMMSLQTYATNYGANLTGWTLKQAWGVSNDGTAVSGTGFFNGQERGFLIQGLPCINGFFIQNPNPTTIVATSGTVGGGAGTTAHFTVDADGAGPLEYSWQVSLGAGSPPITISGPQFADPLLGLSFTVQGWNTPQITISDMRSGILPRDISFHSNVTNPCGIVQSLPATLSIVASCPADFNFDNAVDFFDYLDFVDAFSSGLSTADFNRDQSIDFFDYLDFVDAFSAGC